MRFKTMATGVTLGCAAAISLLAGGFALEIARPVGNAEAQAKKAILLVRSYACADPEKTVITATAEGIVNGNRKSLPLKLEALSQQSTFALARQWPAEGRWVITVTASNPRFGWTPGEMVKVEGDSVAFNDVERLSHAPTKDEVEAALRTESIAMR
jgi:hypothetical protein